MFRKGAAAGACVEFEPRREKGSGSLIYVTVGNTICAQSESFMGVKVMDNYLLIAKFIKLLEMASRIQSVTEACPRHGKLETGNFIRGGGVTWTAARLSRCLLNGSSP